MGNNKEKSLQASSELRRLAEERFRANKTDMHLPRTEAETLRLLHELEVHQVELEMQNSELHQAREEVDKVLEKYTDLYDFAPVGYFTLDRNGTISAANLSGAGLLGVERARLPGIRFGLYVADEARLLFADFLEKVFASRGKESCEAMLRREGNHALFVQLEAVAFGSGRECRVAVIDITERRDAEVVIESLHTALAARAAELETANLELEAFNYTVAHDLRQPLNIVTSYCQVLKEICGDKFDEQCKGYIQGCYDGTLRMDRLIKALLNFSRLIHIEPSRDLIDLSTLAHEVATNLKLTAPERQVDFRIADRIVANADTNLSRVVLDNLFGNAWKFTGERKEAVIEFGATEIDAKPAYFVRDNGAGFDMADANKLFAPFQRLPGAEDFNGFGIGLATVERIIRRHGGRVWAEGEPGKGSCFYFTLSENR